MVEYFGSSTALHSPVIFHYPELSLPWTAQGWLHPFHRPQKHRRRCYDGSRMSKWAMYTCFNQPGMFWWQEINREIYVYIYIYTHRLLIVHLWFAVWYQRTPALKKLKCLVASIASWMAEWKKVSACGRVVGNERSLGSKAPALCGNHTAWHRSNKPEQDIKFNACRLN